MDTNLRFISAIALAATAVLVVRSATAADIDVIATGLHNPRALALDWDGNLLVAEAGLGAGGEAGATTAGVGLTGASARSFDPVQRIPILEDLSQA